MVTHGRFQSKIQEIKNGESEKSCDVVFGLLTSGFSFWPVVPGGLPKTAYTGKLHPKELSFLGFRYKKGWGFS